MTLIFRKLESMKFLEPQSPLFKEIAKHGVAAALGQLAISVILVYTMGTTAFRETPLLAIPFALMFIGIILRLGVSVDIEERLSTSLPLKNWHEVAFGIGALLPAAGLAALACSLFALHGFSNLNTVLALVCVCATSSGSITSLAGVRWISQSFLAITLASVSLFLLAFNHEAHALSMLIMIFWGYLGHFAGVTRAKLISAFKNEDEIRWERERLRHFVDSLPTSISHLDSSLRYAAANTMHMSTLGELEADIIGKSILPTDPFYEDAQTLALDPHETALDKRVCLPTAEGERWHSVKLRKLEGSGEIICFAIDIHNETMLANAQRESQGRLIQSAKMASLGEMAGGISHEINNPLAIIVGKTDLMLDRLARGPIATDVLLKDLAKLKDTAFRISKIIRGLRAFARSGENDPFNPSMITPLVEDSLELCRERFRHSGVDLRVDLSYDAEIACRPSQISQVVLNLLNNGFDAVQGSANAWIEIKTELRGNAAAIIVTDSGLGIPPHVLTRLMEPFFTTKAVNKGTGLGLSISKSLIEDHGGTLTYDASCPNTRFVIQFADQVVAVAGLAA